MIGQRLGADIDPFQLEVIRSSFDTIADDMAITLMRTAHSSIVRDSLDFSTALCDGKGNTLAQGLCTPMQLGSFPDFMRRLISDFDGRVHPEDVFIANDPYAASGQHLPDIYIAMPIFHRGVISAWATTIAHHSDVGGIVAGSNSIGVTEIFQEGVRLPILKFIDAGKPNDALWEVIALNVRTPDKVIGDLQAQIAGCTSGRREMTALLERYSLPTVQLYADYLQDYTEQLARAEIREMPDGDYSFTDYIDGLGLDGEPIRLNVSVKIDGDRAIVDWDGSSSQVKGGINPSFPFTKACAYTAFRSIMLGDVPHTDGFTRAIEVRAPVGSIMNPVFPAPCGGRGITGYRMIDCLFGALAKAVPDRVMADGNGGSTLPSIGGYQNGKAFVFCETFMGTWGATINHDGQEGVPHMGSNQSNVPIEMVETEYPIRIEYYGMVNGTGGPGRNRGGLALRRDYRVLCDEAVLNVRSDKQKYPPHGLLFGGDGSPAKNVVYRGTSDTRQLPILMTHSEELRKGDVFQHVMASGGGFGHPLERSPERVLWDVIEDKVSRDQARAVYGVVLIEEVPYPKVHDSATRALRDEMLKGLGVKSVEEAGRWQ